MTVWVAALTGCSSVSIEGRVVDGLTNEPVAGPFKVKLKASSADAAISCQFLEGDVSAEGTFKVERLCKGTAYTLDTDKDDIWLADGGTVPDGGWGKPTDLVAWRVPKAPGLYKLSGGVIEPLKTAAEVKSEKIWNSEQRVRYPAKIPNEVAVIGPDDHLIEVGEQAVTELKVWPLVPSGQRKFGDPSVTWTMEPWVYVGTTFTDDATFTVTEATPDPGKVIDKAGGDRKARFVSGAALPAGRYAILAEKDVRMYILDFGSGQGTPAPTANEPAPAGG